MIYGDQVRTAVLNHAESSYPRECCGLVLEGTGGEHFYRPCRNIQAEEPVLDPHGKVRGAETAFHLDGRDIMQAERDGHAIVAIVHSHVEHDAYFSAMDRAVATYQWGEEEPVPTYPGVVYLVVSVQRGRAEEERWFQWSSPSGEFVEVSVPGSKGPGAP